MSAEQDSLRRQQAREQRLTTFIAAVATGAIQRRGHPHASDRHSAAADIVAFAVELEKASRDLYS